jgi:hypothetical protein
MRTLPTLATFLLALGLPSLAQAFCGFYVGGADAKLLNNATNVVMMREGKTTVLSMQNDYEGPPQDFAMVVPVPVVLKKANVKTLPRDVFERVDRLAAPRLVEYWERDPCYQPRPVLLGMMGTGSGAGGIGYGRGASRLGNRVTVKARFEVGEYQIVILDAKDAAGLEHWLIAHEYRIPANAAPLLRPYIRQGMQFFVAKVNPKKVKFKAGRAVLSPLRMHYESTDFRLPVRLGLINSSGTQDLLVHVLARSQRYEVANRPNVTIPTNLDVADAVRDQFGAFYAGLFDATLAKHPGAAVTEYAWQATKCDPCPGPVLSNADLLTLGADVALETAVSTLKLTPERMIVRGALDKAIIRRIMRRHRNRFQYCVDREMVKRPLSPGKMTVKYIIDPNGRVSSVKLTERLGVPAVEQCIAKSFKRMRFPQPKGGGIVMIDQPFTLKPGPPRVRGNSLMGMVLTRLHLRYTPQDLGEDLIFAPAPPIVGGREVATGGLGTLETGATKASVNNFQGRYAIRHPWTGPVQCKNPRRGIWGGPPEGTSKVRPALDLSQVKRDALPLKMAVPGGVPELGIGPR